MIVISRLVISSENLYSNQAPLCPSKRLGQGAATQIYDKRDVKDHPFQFNKNLLVSATHGIVLNTHTKHQGNGKISYDQDGGYTVRALSINEDVRLVMCICESCIYLNRLVQYSLHIDGQTINVHHYFLLHAVGVTSHEDILEKLRSEEAKSNMTRDGVVIGAVLIKILEKIFLQN